MFYSLLFFLGGKGKGGSGGKGSGGKGSDKKEAKRGQ